MPSTHIECDGEGDGTADGEVLGVPDDEGEPDGLAVWVPDELGAGVGLAVALARGEGVAVLPTLPCLA